MVVCYELMSWHYKIIYCILHQTILEEIVFTYLMLLIRNDRTYCVDCNVVKGIAEKKRTMFSKPVFHQAHLIIGKSV